MIVYVANPLYDAVFKYLMEDERIAKTILSGSSVKCIHLYSSINGVPLGWKPNPYSAQAHEPGFIWHWLACGLKGRPSHCVEYINSSAGVGVAFQAALQLSWVNPGSWAWAEYGSAFQADGTPYLSGAAYFDHYWNRKLLGFTNY